MFVWFIAPPPPSPLINTVHISHHLCHRLNVLFFSFTFCTGITAFNRMAHARSKFVWSRCIYSYVHLMLFLTWITLSHFLFHIGGDGGRNFSHTKWQTSAAHSRLFFCCCLHCCCCLSCVLFSLDYITVCLGDDLTYLRARASSVERWASSCKVIWFV